MSLAWHWYAYTILSVLVDFTAEADIHKSARAQWSRYANSRYRGSDRAGACNYQRGEAMDSESQDRSADV